MTVLQAMDLAGIFTLLLAASGCILLADWAFFKRRRLRGAEGMIVREPLLVEYARSFFPVILIVLLIRAFVIEPFRMRQSEAQCSQWPFTCCQCEPT